MPVSRAKRFSYPMKTILLLLAACLGAAAACRAATATKPLGLPDGPTYSLAYPPGDDHATLGVYIRVQPPEDFPDLGKIKAVVETAQTPDGTSPAGLAARFVPNLSVAGDVNGLTVAVEKPEELLPGRYRLVIKFAPIAATGENARIPLPPPLDLALNREPAALAPQGTLVIGQEIGWDATSAVPGRLTLREQSSKADVAKFEIHDERDNPANPFATVGKLDFAEEKSSIPAGRAITVEVSPKGEFSPGTYSGHLRVQSTNLKDDLLVTYTLRVRRHPGWIIVCAIVGIALGWTSRTLLQRLISEAQSRLAASKAVAEIDKLLKSTPDKEFQKSVKPIRHDLATQPKWVVTAETLNTAVKDAQTKLAAKVTEFNGRCAEVGSRIDEFYAALSAAYILPPPVKQTATLALDELTVIKKLLAGRQPDDAVSTIDNTLKPSLVALLQKAAEWRAATGLYLGLLSENPPALSEGAKDAMNSRISGWQANFEITTVPTVPTGGDVVDGLKTLHNAYLRGVDLARFLDSAGQDFVLSAREKLSACAPATFDPLLVSGQDVAARTLADLARAQPDSQQPRLRAEDQRALWLKTLAAALPVGTSAQSIETSLKTWQWAAAVDAAKGLFPQPKINPPNTPPPNPKTVPAAAAASRSQSKIIVPGEYVPLPVLPPAAQLASLTLTGSAREQGRFAREAKWYGFIQSGIVGTLYVAASYRFFVNDWVGTYTDIFGIIAWGFFVDFSVNALTPIMKKTIPASAVT